MVRITRGSTCSNSNPCTRGTPGTQGRNDAADPDTPRAYPRRIGTVDVTADDHGPLLAEVGGITTAGKRVDGYYLYSPKSSVSNEKYIAKHVCGIDDKRAHEKVKDWEHLARRLSRFSNIKHLVLSFHGTPGRLDIGGRFVDIGRKDNLQKFTAAAPSLPRVEHVSFFGCQVMGRPQAALAFAKLLRPKNVDGYTWYIQTKPVGATIPQGADSGGIKKVLASFAEFIIPKPDSAALAQRAATQKKEHSFLAIYGSREFKEASFPMARGQERYVKPLDQAPVRRIRGSQVQALQEEYAKPVMSLGSGFEKVVITLP